VSTHQGREKFTSAVVNGSPDEDPLREMEKIRCLGSDETSIIKIGIKDSAIPAYRRISVRVNTPRTFDDLYPRACARVLIPIMENPLSVGRPREYIRDVNPMKRSRQSRLSVQTLSLWTDSA